MPDLMLWHKWLPNWSSFKLARDHGRVQENRKSFQGKDPINSLQGTHQNKKQCAYSLPSSFVNDSKVLTEEARPKHLVVFVHGLWGTRNDWRNIYRHFSSVLRSCTYLLHISTANEGLNTYSGVDVCGQRLAAEMQDIVDRNPSLTHISIIGHSLGGLISRYAVGHSFDPATGQVLGLQPTHFITLATPHMGATWTGVAQVPLIHTFTSAPVVGPLLQNLQSRLQPVTGWWLGRTGEMLFHLDAPGCQPERRPLLEAMCWDQPESNLYCYSALASFKTRTCYANAVGDHMVGWANASVRHLDQLPDFTEQHLKGAVGVVAEDALPAASDLRASLYFLHQKVSAFAERTHAALSKASLARSSGSPQRWRSSSPWGSRSMATNGIPDLSPHCRPRSPRSLKMARTFSAVATRLGLDVRLAGGEGDNKPDASARNDADGGRRDKGSVGSDSDNIHTGLLEGDGCFSNASRQTRDPASSTREFMQGKTAGANLRPVLLAARPGVSTAAAAAGSSAVNTPQLDAPGQLPSAVGPDIPTPEGATPMAAASVGMAVVCAAAEIAAAAAEAAVESASRGRSGAGVPVGQTVVGGAIQLEAAVQEDVLDNGDAVQDDVALRIVARLQTLAWRRIDVSFKAAVLGFAHNNIQYNRPINFAGRSVISHLALTLEEMEAALKHTYDMDDGVQGATGAQQEGELEGARGHKLRGESMLTAQEDNQISASLFSVQDP